MKSFEGEALLSDCLSKLQYLENLILILDYNFLDYYSASYLFSRISKMNFKNTRNYSRNLSKEPY